MFLQAMIEIVLIASLIAVEKQKICVLQGEVVQPGPGRLPTLSGSSILSDRLGAKPYRTEVLSSQSWL